MSHNVIILYGRTTLSRSQERLLILINMAIWLTRGYASLLLTFFPTFYVGIQIYRAECPQLGSHWDPDSLRHGGIGCAEPVLF